MLELGYLEAKRELVEHMYEKGWYYGSDDQELDLLATGQELDPQAYEFVESLKPENVVVNLEGVGKETTALELRKLVAKASGEKFFADLVSVYNEKIKGRLSQEALEYITNG